VPRYVVERELGDVAEDALIAAAEAATALRERDFPEIGWERSHVVRGGGGLRAYCIYSAPGPDAIRAYSARAGLPVDRIDEIRLDLLPDDRAAERHRGATRGPTG
jgi:hypothetical protein